MSGTFPNVQFFKRQLPKSVLVAALGPSMFKPRRSAPKPQCSFPIAACGASESLTFGKLPLGKLHIWEVATGKIDAWQVDFGKIPLGKYLTPYSTILVLVYYCVVFK